MSHIDFQQWIDFCKGNIKTTDGRKINDIWHFNFDQIKLYQDDINWLFPITRHLRHNTALQHAPVWDEDVWQQCANKPAVIGALNRSVLTMLKYYGIQYENKRFSLMTQAPMRYNRWLTNNSNEQQMISRMLTSLVMVGETGVARQLNHFLRSSMERHGVITEAPQYWQHAIAG